MTKSKEKVQLKIPLLPIMSLSLVVEYIFGYFQEQNCFPDEIQIHVRNFLAVLKMTQGEDINDVRWMGIRIKPYK